MPDAERPPARTHTVPIAAGSAIGAFGAIAMLLDQVGLIREAATALGPVGLIGLLGFGIYTYSTEQRIGDLKERASSLERALETANRKRDEREASRERILETLSEISASKIQTQPPPQPTQP